MNFGLLCAGLCTAVFLMGSSQAHAQYGGGDGKWRERMESQVQAIYAQLNLTEEQKKFIEENKAKHKSEREALSGQLKELTQTLGDELKKDPLDESKINSLHEQFKNVRNQMADERFQGILEVRKILTPDQFKKFLSLLDEQRQKSSADTK